MLTYVARRLLLAVPVLLGVVFVVMLTVELIPGDAVALMLGEHATPEAVARLRDYLGLDKPLMVRYAAYVGHVARGDLGRSIQQNRPVVDELADAWPATLELTVAALVLAAAAGVAAGVVSAVWPNSLFDAVARVGSLFGLSMPVFWTGLVLIVVFALWLPWLPVGGAGSLGHLVLPAVTLALPSVAMVARMTRSSVLEVLREDYVRTARAKGVAERLVVSKHALRNAAIPILTLLGLQAGQLMGGAVLTETVFAWPGLGRLMVKAIFARDYVLLQGAVLVFALAFVLINLAGGPGLRRARSAHRAAGLGDGDRRARARRPRRARRARDPVRGRLAALPAEPARDGGAGGGRAAGDRGRGRAVARPRRSGQAEPDREAGAAGRQVHPGRRRVRPRHPLARDLRHAGWRSWWAGSRWRSRSRWR